MGSLSSHSNDPDPDHESQSQSQPQSQSQSQFEDGVTMADYLAFTTHVSEKMRKPSCSLDGFEKALGERGVSEESKNACVPQDYSYSLGTIVFYGSYVLGKSSRIPGEWHDWARRVTRSALSRGDPSRCESLARMTDMELSGETISTLSASVVANDDLRQVAAPALSALSRLEDSSRGLRGLLRSLSGSSTSSRPGTGISSITELEEGQQGQQGQGQDRGDGVRTPPRSSAEISTRSGCSPLQKLHLWGSPKSRSGGEP
ncbi:hypothetical protein EHS25_009961 [Saitozyma podzolica]|uniref:Uncharacterized protein n=1 Tax=Saitozyma podzolica TaxID=1890683 RepID=A0A427YI67_9TREE|nr:hypothetical protein EHS25_009961 [Saitozyma podzolica]